MKYLFLPGIVWDAYKYQNQDLPYAFAEKGITCIYINPIIFEKWAKKSLRLQKLSSNPVPENLTVVHRLSKMRFAPLMLLFENISNLLQIRKHRPDKVFSFDHLTSAFSCIYCKMKGIKFVFILVDDWTEINKNSGLKNIYWKYFSKPILHAFSFAVSSTSYRQFELSKKIKTNSFYIPYGKPISFAIESANSNSPVKNTVNFAAHLRDWYDFELLFAVFKELPELELNIYGIGELYEQLKEKSKQYNNIHILGNIQNERLPELIAESLFGIIPLKLNKLNESVNPAKLYDYWSAKKAVIASPVNELKIIGNGIILFAATKEEYLFNIRMLLSDKKTNRSLGEAGYNLVKTAYNYEIITAQYEKITK